mgnify:CR=1 FL=1
MCSSDLVNTYEQAALKAKGWTFKPGASEAVEVEKAPEKKLSITDQAKALGIKIKDNNEIGRASCRERV